MDSKLIISTEPYDIWLLWYKLFCRLNEIYSDLTHALSTNVQPADIGSIYRVYHDITTLRTLYNDYVDEGGDKSTQGRKSNTPIILIP